MSISDASQEAQKSQLALNARKAILEQKFDEALNAYDQYIKLDPNDLHGYDGMATTLHYLQRTEDERKVRAYALKVCEESLRGNPRDLSILQSKAHLLAFFGRLDDALTVYDQILQLDGENWVAVLQKGTLLTQLGRSTEAAPYLMRAKQLEDQVRQKMLQRQTGNR